MAPALPSRASRRHDRGSGTARLRAERRPSRADRSPSGPQRYPRPHPRLPAGSRERPALRTAPRRRPGGIPEAVRGPPQGLARRLRCPPGARGIRPPQGDPRRRGTAACGQRRLRRGRPPPGDDPPAAERSDARGPLAFPAADHPSSQAPARSAACRTAWPAPSRTQPRAPSHPLNARSAAHAPSTRADTHPACGHAARPPPRSGHGHDIDTLWAYRDRGALDEPHTQLVDRHRTLANAQIGVTFYLKLLNRLTSGEFPVDGALFVRIDRTVDQLEEAANARDAAAQEVLAALEPIEAAAAASTSDEGRLSTDDRAAL